MPPTNAPSPKSSCAKRFSAIDRRCTVTSPRWTARRPPAALWFRNFSTWDGVAGIYLEDLFVRPQFRRRGLARKMLAALARECVAGGYTRLSWAVLDWNVNAISLYDAVGGKPQNEWITYRVSGPELSALADES